MSKTRNSLLIGFTGLTFFTGCLALTSYVDNQKVAQKQLIDQSPALKSDLASGFEIALTNTANSPTAGVVSTATTESIPPYPAPTPPETSNASAAPIQAATPQPSPADNISVAPAQPAPQTPQIKAKTTKTRAS